MATDKEIAAARAAVLSFGTMVTVDGPALIAGIRGLYQDRASLLSTLRRFLPEDDEPTFADDTHRLMVLAALFAIGYNEGKRRQQTANLSQN